MSKLAVVLVEDNYEDLELHYPRLRLIEAGFTVKTVGPSKKTYKSKFGYWATCDTLFNEVDPSSVAVLVIPGGWAPDRLRRFPECVALVANCHKAGAVIGHICHGGSLAVSARILKGVRSTSFSSIKDDLEFAGAIWLDERVVSDHRIVSAQTPEDLPGFMKEILKLANQ
jgi:protease I